MKKLILISSIFFLLITSKISFCYELTEKEEKTFTLKNDSFISIIGDEGFISVKSWNKEKVHLKITKRAWGRSKREAKKRLENIEIEITQSDDRLNISQLKIHDEHNMSFWDLFDPDRWGNINYSVSVDFELTVPHNVDLRLETDEGDINIDDINGDIDIDADEGDIKLNDINFEDIDIYLDEGDLNCRNLFGRDGRLTIDTDEGLIKIVNGKMKILKIECDEGDIILQDLVSESCEISTDEGDIDFSTEIKKNGRYYLYSDEGDITLSLKKNPNVNIKLSTDEGSIYSDFDINIDNRDNDGERARGTIGRGGAKLDIYTDEGDIQLEKK